MHKAEMVALDKSKKLLIGNLPWTLYWLSPFRFVTRATLFLFWGVGWIWPVVYFVGALFFTNFSSLDILSWRSFNQDNLNMQALVKFYNTNDYSNHHFLNLVLMAGFGISFSYWFYKTHNSLWQDKMKFQYSGIFGSYAMILVWCVHEGLWWLFYIMSVNFHVKPIWFDGDGEWITLALLLCTVTMGLFAPKKFFLSMLAFYLVWFAVGFPITVNYQGNTPLYGSLWGDGWEVGSWAFAVFGFWFLERDHMMRWFGKVKFIALFAQETSININNTPEPS